MTLVNLHGASKELTMYRLNNKISYRLQCRILQERQALAWSHFDDNTCVNIHFLSFPKRTIMNLANLLYKCQTF